MPDDALPDPSTTEPQAAPSEGRPAAARPRRAPAPAPVAVPRRRVTKAAPAPPGAAPSPAIASKLKELEARLAVPPAPVADVPADVLAPQPPAEVPVPPRPVRKAAAKQLPAARWVPAKPAAGAAPSAVPEAVPAALPEPELPPMVEPARVAVLLSVLLLALAAGLGAAALVLSRTATFEARTIVQLVPVAGSGSQDALRAAVRSYEKQVAGRDLTGETSASVGVRRSELRDEVRTQPVGSDKIRLVVRAGSAGDAEAVAQAAGAALVELVVIDQTNNAPAPADTLSATVVGKTAAERVKPSNTDAGLASGLAAAAVLLLAGSAAAVGRRRSPAAA